ncbi:PRC-barrel domain-containing protein [Paraconexibacter antarcticus]|uniref:PRC-barrel domain-containing protein n=1 Tax=Paraconexibacter antarcticus TaxID=2949664 RepID=A0ABY5E053_9ACTN|nr:PRC-barrel domain-containing protein [Paraconexibacter antarcticus]UTI67003.1 PRC-barrel domain-containing protein [Paraconexibacter antarcticus]
MLVEQLEQWIGAEVVDPDGASVGRLGEVYFRGSEPVLIAAKGGRLSRKRRLVPLDGATASRDHVRIAFPAGRLLETKGGADPLSAEDLAAVAEHYGAAHAADPAELEGSHARAERLRVAAEAERRAAELEAEAEAQAARADDAGQRAEQASEAARRAEEERREVSARAEAARDAARQL